MTTTRNRFRKLVRCPQCNRVFADQLCPRYGYVFPVHVMNPAPERRERYIQCPGSRTPIAAEYRRAA